MHRLVNIHHPGQGKEHRQNPRCPLSIESKVCVLLCLLCFARENSWVAAFPAGPPFPPLHSIPLYEYTTIILICSTVDGILGCLQFRGKLMNNVAMNILHRPLGEKIFLVDMCLGIKLLLVRRTCFQLQWIKPDRLQSDHTCSNSHQSWTKPHVATHLVSTWYYQIFKLLILASVVLICTCVPNNQ